MYAGIVLFNLPCYPAISPDFVTLDTSLLFLARTGQRQNKTQIDEGFHNILKVTCYLHGSCPPWHPGSNVELIDTRSIEAPHVRYLFANYSTPSAILPSSPRVGTGGIPDEIIGQVGPSRGSRHLLNVD